MTRTIPGAMQTMLASRATTVCLCWKVARQDGVILGFTDHDQPLTFGGVTYEATASFTASAVENQLGLAVSNLDVMGALSSDAITEDDLVAGRYDGAVVTISMVNWKDVTQNFVLMKGTLGQVTHGDLVFQAEIRSLGQHFAQYVGSLCGPKCRSPFGDTGKGLEGGCRYPIDPAVWTSGTAVTLGDQRVPTVANGWQYEVTTAGTTGGSEPSFPTTAGATVNDNGVIWTARRGVKRTGVVTAVTDRKTFTIGSIPGDVSFGTGGSVAGGFFAFGTVEIQAPASNAGLAKEISTFTAPGDVTLLFPFPFDISVGDNVILRAGCDKTLETCRDNWRNIVKLRGEPYVPGSDAVFKVNSEKVT